MQFQKRFCPIVIFSCLPDHLRKCIHGHHLLLLSQFTPSSFFLLSSFRIRKQQQKSANRSTNPRPTAEILSGKNALAFVLCVFCRKNSVIWAKPHSRSSAQQFGRTECLVGHYDMGIPHTFYGENICSVFFVCSYLLLFCLVDSTFFIRSFKQYLVSNHMLFTTWKHEGRHRDKDRKTYLLAVQEVS